MSSKNKSSNTLNPESLELERLREGIKALQVVLDKVLDAVNAVYDEAAKPAKQDKQDKLTPGLHPVFKKSAQKAFQNLADSRKKAAEAAKPSGTAKKSASGVGAVMNALMGQAVSAARAECGVPPKKPVKQAKAPAKSQAPVPKPAPKPVKQAATPTKAEPTNDQTGVQPGKQVKRASASVRLTPHELTLNIGAQPVRELAEQDAKDLLNNPKVFWYRPIQFPDPKRYQVQPRIESARVVERKAAKFSRSPWTVSVTIAAIGDDKRCESWLTGVLAKNRGEQE